MTDYAYSWPAHDRQILLNVGNRYVLFASPRTLPPDRAFDPADGSRPLSRVPDEQEVFEQRTIQSLRVSDAKVVPQPSSDDRGWDFELVDAKGTHTLVEMKVRNRDLKRADYQKIFDQFRSYAGTSSSRIEVWNLNIERLVLQILWQDSRGMVNSVDLTPLDVWDFGAEGDSVFRRSQVIAEVDNWSRRIDRLYGGVESWASCLGLHTDRSRTVTMSEELMQNFAVPDRELPVLDVSRDDQYIISFVPHGLWLIGSRGRIDVITHSGTRALVDLGTEAESNWCLIDPENRGFSPFDQAAFLKLVGAT